MENTLASVLKGKPAIFSFLLETNKSVNLVEMQKTVQNWVHELEQNQLHVGENGLCVNGWHTELSFSMQYAVCSRWLQKQQWVRVWINCINWALFSQHPTSTHITLFWSEPSKPPEHIYNLSVESVYML